MTGVLRGGFARTGEIEELGTRLGTHEGARPASREALAATLGDPIARAAVLARRQEEPGTSMRR